MSFGERLRRRREEKGMTQQQLARQLGISRTTLWRYLGKIEAGEPADPT